MNGILPWIQIILSIVLVISILLQKSESSLGGAFGSGNDSGATYHTRRGFEKFLFRLTIVLAILLATSSILAVM
ncbi:MAG: preprotein translocase subunit SecG [Patescibacteria group bacterium]|jgi:protein translocase SecG subunit|nr:preprotein translocase subunit SecG [Patescibacteria group bacterium]